MSGTGRKEHSRRPSLSFFRPSPSARPPVPDQHNDGSGGVATTPNGGSSSAGVTELSSPGLQPDAVISRTSSISHMYYGAERTVKRLKLSKALTIPESTSVREACRRMVTRKVDAVLLTDSNAMLCGILTDKDVTKRVIACELNLDETPASRVMTKNPTFVPSEVLAVEALQKMVHGKFRHLPVVENGEVIALLDIQKCLYDAITRMERAAESGKALAAAVEGVKERWGSTVSGPTTFIETLRERMFKPSVSTIISDNSKVVAVLPTDSVLSTTKKMVELKIASAVITVDDRPIGILTCKDILMRVIAQNLPPESTPVEQVMTPNPKCGTLDMSILDALQTMHAGKFLHLPVVNKDMKIVTVLDVIHLTHAAVATAGSPGGIGSEAASSAMQRFWDSAMALEPVDDDDSRSEGSSRILSEVPDLGRLTPGRLLPRTFVFKLKDKRGTMHRFPCGINSLADLVAGILQRMGDEIDRNNLPQILYEDAEHDKVIIQSDSDLTAAVEHAKQAGLSSLKLHLDYSGTPGRGDDLDFQPRDAWASAYSAVAAGAALVAGLGMMAYLRRA